MVHCCQEKEKYLDIRNVLQIPWWGGVWNPFNPFNPEMFGGFKDLLTRGIWWPKDKVDGDRSVWTYIMFLFGKNLISKNVVSYNLGNSKHKKYLKIDQKFKTVLVFLSYRDRMEVIQLTVTCQSNFLTENSQAQWGKKAEGCLVTPYSSDFLCLDCLAS